MPRLEDLQEKIKRAHPLILMFLTQMVEDGELNKLLEVNRSRSFTITLYGNQGKPSKRPRINFQ